MLGLGTLAFDLMLALIALGVMSIGWMVALTLLIVFERTAPAGERIAVSSLQLLRDGAPVKEKGKPAPVAGTEGGGGSTGGSR